jgi:NAD(P)-dependent dehydrogenase (short-subunit alcohol dehydrogenase family)
MDLQLKGRRVLVTGSSSGIGAAVARMLAEESARVVVHGRDRERAEAVAKEIGAAGVAIGELSTDEACNSVHAEAVAALGGNIEILINNAGGNSEGNSTKPPHLISGDHYLSNFNANALAAIRLTNLSIPAMSAAKFGRVINVSSAVAVQPNNMGADYSAAKAAMNNFTVSLAGALKGEGITVNTVSPGIVMVDGLLRMGRERLGNPDATFEEVTDLLVAAGVFTLPPAGRLGIPDDLAIIICTLASPRSGYVTGANYRVDGGQIRSLN